MPLCGPLSLQIGSIASVVFVAACVFLPYLRHLNRRAAVTKRLLLQFPHQLFTAVSTPPELAATRTAAARRA